MHFFQLQTLCLIFFFFPLSAFDKSVNPSENKKENLLKKDLFTEKVSSVPPHSSITPALWKQIRPHLMPNSHPAKEALNLIFSASRAFFNLDTMIAAGFAPAIPQHHTQIIVTKHSLLKGYVIKAYLDVQKYHSKKPESYFWIKRATGAKYIRHCIANHGFLHLLKVPHKWIYLLPNTPPPAKCLKKRFILVEEDMDIYDDPTNLAIWGSEWVTPELLKALYTVITELGLFDCAKPANCPISKDGRVAFVDTQSYHSKKVKYHKLTHFLSPNMRQYWLSLIAAEEY